MMREKPNLEDDYIIACLRDSYGIRVASIEFLPIGHDSYAATYEVNAQDNQRYFLKVRLDSVYPPSVIIPHFLLEQGIEQIIAPIPTTTGDLVAALDSLSLILYPFIDAQKGMEIGLSASQWIEFGAALKKVHTLRLPAEIADQVRKEDFVPDRKWTPILKRLHAEVPYRAYDNPYQRDLATFWRTKVDEIGRVINRTEELGGRLQGLAHELVLCHADIHTANVLITPEGKLYLVDWDLPVLAPKEQDLMFVLGASLTSVPITNEQQELFLQGYGDVEVDQLAMAYYLYERVVEDLGAFGEDVFLREDISDETREDSLKYFVVHVEGAEVIQAADKWAAGS